MGGLEEKVALYADDMLLFLCDAGPSLQGALKLLNTYSLFRGLMVNWGKSLLFAIDQGVQDTAALNVPLQWVAEFKYLGIIISRQAEDFPMLNLNPVVQNFWREVVGVIATVTSIVVEQDVEICLLGLVGNNISVVKRTQVSLLLIYARKAIVLSWKKAEAPSLAFSKDLVNNNLSLYRETYCNRGCG